MPINDDKLQKIRSHFDQWFPGYSETVGMSNETERVLRSVVDNAVKLSKVDAYCSLVGCSATEASQVKQAYQTFINYVSESRKMRTVPPPAHNTRIPHRLLFGFLGAVAVPLIQQSSEGVLQAIRSFLLEDEIDDIELAQQIQALFDQIGVALSADQSGLDVALTDRVADQSQAPTLEERIEQLESMVRSALETVRSGQIGSVRND